MENLELIKYITLFIILIPISVIDIRKHIIPNSINLVAAIIGVVFIYLERENYKTYLFGALFGLLFFILIIVASELIMKKQGMGEGDAKLMAVIGLFLGLPNTIFVTFLSFVLGAIYSLYALIFRKKKKGEEIPFGPFISVASIVAMLWGEQIIKWYLSLKY